MPAQNLILLEQNPHAILYYPEAALVQWQSRPAFVRQAEFNFGSILIPDPQRGQQAVVFDLLLFHTPELARPFCVLQVLSRISGDQYQVQIGCWRGGTARMRADHCQSQDIGVQESPVRNFLQELFDLVCAQWLVNKVTYPGISGPGRPGWQARRCP